MSAVRKTNLWSILIFATCVLHRSFHESGPNNITTLLYYITYYHAPLIVCWFLYSCDFFLMTTKKKTQNHNAGTSSDVRGATSGFRVRRLHSFIQ